VCYFGNCVGRETNALAARCAFGMMKFHFSNSIRLTFHTSHFLPLLSHPSSFQVRWAFLLVAFHLISEISRPFVDEEYVKITMKIMSLSVTNEYRS
jgi:hypothetical protein